MVTVKQFYHTLFSHRNIQWLWHFPSGTLVMVWAWKLKSTLLIVIIATINDNIGFTCNVHENVQSVHKVFTV